MSGGGMAGEADQPGVVRVARGALGERLGGFIYGTIIVLAVLVAGARAYPDDAARIAALVGVTAVVFWIAHVYAHSLARSVAHDERFSLAALRRIARREGSIVEAAVPPIVALLLGAAGVFSTTVAVWLALAFGIVVLVVQGLVFAHLERLGLLGTLLVVTANVALGVALVALKLVLSH